VDLGRLGWIDGLHEVDLDGIHTAAQLQDIFIDILSLHIHTYFTYYSTYIGPIRSDFNTFCIFIQILNALQYIHTHMMHTYIHGTKLRLK
jgi:hypothetical protein